MTNCSGQLIGVPSAGRHGTQPRGRIQRRQRRARVCHSRRPGQGHLRRDHHYRQNPTHGYFGIQVVQIPPAAAQKAGTPEGLYVAGVVPGGPAATAGLQEGDIITEINGEPATDPNQLQAITITQRAGDTVDVTYDRNGQSHKTTITLGSQP